MDEEFRFQLVEEFGGYNSSRDKTTLLPNFLIRGSKNVYKKISGTIASRPGLKRRGAADSTAAGVKSSFEWKTSKGTIRPLRVVNGKLQVESDIATADTFVWYELFETGAITTSLAATLTRWVFSTWWDNDEKSDRLLMVRGDDKIFHWSGGIAKIGTVTANTIRLADTAKVWTDFGFASQIAGEKKMIINGIEYTYTGGETTNTLTGVTPNPSGEASNSIAIQSVILGDNLPVDGYKADFCLNVENQFWVGSYSSRIVYISANVTVSGTLGFLNFTNTGALLTGDPDAIIMDSPGKGLGIKNGKVIIFSGDSDLYVVTPNFDLPVSQAAIPITGGTSRNVVQKVEKKFLPGLNSALGHEFIGNLGNALIWLDQKNQLRGLDSLPASDIIIPQHLSLPVKDELADDDFSGGHLRAIEDTIYITAPNNGRDWIYSIRETLTDQGGITYEKIWHPPQIRGIQRFAIINGVIYGHNNINPQIYQVWDTNQWFDDNPSDEPIPYTCVARFAYRNSGKRFRLNTFNKYWIEGYMPSGVKLLANIYFEYQGAESLQAKIINVIGDPVDPDNPAKFWQGNPYPSLGDSPLGDNPLGDGIIPEGGEQEQVPKFRKIIDVNPVNNFEHTIEIYSVSADARWELLTLGPNMKTSEQLPAFLRG